MAESHSANNELKVAQTCIELQFVELISSGTHSTCNRSTFQEIILCFMLKILVNEAVSMSMGLDILLFGGF